MHVQQTTMGLEIEDTFQADVVAGLRQPRKSLPSKYFYDAIGSELFEQICELDEYYPTRIELGIMQQNIGDVSRAIGHEHVLLELGSGSSTKTELLLANIEHLAAYVPFDISRSALDDAFAKLSQRFPDLDIHPVCGDFMQEIGLPRLDAEYSGTVTYFPGSTIGNLTNDSAISLLRRIRAIDKDSDLLIGIDLEKDRRILLDAYNDSAGVTAEFNLNLLDRINRELDANFDLGQFDHLAVFNEHAHRIEMHLVSQSDQTVNIDNEIFSFQQGESICTEYSHKYTVDRFAKLAAAAKFDVTSVWTDERDWFAVLLLSPSDSTQS